MFRSADSRASGLRVLILLLTVSSAAATTLEPPILLFPDSGAVADNGCTNSCSKTERDFDWSDVPGATRYEIVLQSLNAPNPAVSEIVTDSSYSESEWSWTGSQEGWYWEVRAGDDTGWGDWSEERPVRFEPVNTDCLESNLLPRACIVDSSAWTGDIPFEVEFTAQVTDDDGSIIAYRWDFDDDGRIDTTVIGDPTITHVFTEPGLHTVNLVAVDDRGGTVPSSTRVFATGSLPAEPHRLVFPAVAHAPGAHRTNWRSDISIINWSGTDATLHLRFVPVGGGVQHHIQTTLPGGDDLTFEDVLVSAFNYPEDSELTGVIYLESDQPVVGQARTFNQADEGSFGQLIPAVTADETISGHDVGVLQAIRSNDAFRTNVGVVHMGGPAVCRAVIQIVSMGGEIVGDPVVVDVPQDEYRQVNRIFEVAGATAIERGYAVVEIDTPECVLWSYASVVDELTGDATTSPQTLRP